MIIPNKKFVRKLGKSNTLIVNNATYNHSKLLEEVLELSEVLIKMINKSGSKAPPKEKLIEELGDVLFRAEVLILKEGLTEKVQERIENKIEQLTGYLIEGKYKTAM